MKKKAVNFEENLITIVKEPILPFFCIDSKYLVKNFPQTVGSHFSIASKLVLISGV
tara:strand:- start:171 stop:338 length:168 start_codon:yes stop_codon:yes gene_type:complete